MRNMCSCVSDLWGNVTEPGEMLSGLWLRYNEGDHITARDWVISAEHDDILVIVSDGLVGIQGRRVSS